MYMSISTYVYLSIFLYTSLLSCTVYNRENTSRNNITIPN